MRQSQHHQQQQQSNKVPYQQCQHPLHFQTPRGYVGNSTQSQSDSGVKVIMKQPIVLPRDWTHKTFSCCEDMKECCCAHWCYYCYLCRIAKRIDESCWASLCGGIVPMRTKIRTERKIEGSICKDYCLTWWCPCCAAVQMGREAKETAPLI